MNGSQALIDALRATLLARLEAVIPRGSRVALLDFPNHANVGDTAIWLGELAALRALDCELAYVASFSSWSAAALRRRLGRDGIVLLHGGGNFGDVWPTFQAFRERVIAAHQERRVVQLPQTVHFSRPEAVAGVAAAARHPDLVLMVRDLRSEALLREHFTDVDVRLCTDSAFALGPLTAPEPDAEILCMLRTDLEQTANSLAAPEADLLIADWPKPTRPLYWHRQFSRGLAYPLKRTDTAFLPLLEGPLRRTYDVLARRRMIDGLNLLARGRILVTDRLHGHILALLLGRAHVLLDNSYGKNRAFHELWTAESPLTTFADSLPEALAIARGEAPIPADRAA